jgi:hypothetical protein
MKRSFFSVVMAGFLASSLAFGDELPPCTASNIGQCALNHMCETTPMGPAWVGADAEECHAALPADAPLDKPGVSVTLKAGWVAPYDGHLISKPETKRRADKEADEKATLAAAKNDSVLIPKPVFAAVIAAGIVVIAGGIAATACAASHCIPSSK